MRGAVACVGYMCVIKEEVYGNITGSFRKYSIHGYAARST